MDQPAPTDGSDHPPIPIIARLLHFLEPPAEHNAPASSDDILTFTELTRELADLKWPRDPESPRMIEIVVHDEMTSHRPFVPAVPDLSRADIPPLDLIRLHQDAIATLASAASRLQESLADAMPQLLKEAMKQSQDATWYGPDFIPPVSAGITHEIVFWADQDGRRVRKTRIADFYLAPNGQGHWTVLDTKEVVNPRPSLCLEAEPKPTCAVQ